MDQEEIFKGKTFSGLMKDIYSNSKKKELQISSLILELKPLIKTLSDATIIVPLIKDYMEVAVKNDEHLIKMAAIVQRSMNAVSGPDAGTGLSDIEKKQILDTVHEMEDNSK